MNDAAIVRRGECITNLNRNREGASQLEWPTVDEFSNVQTLHVLHHDKMNIVIVDQVVNATDVGMVQGRSEVGFSFKAL